MQNNHEADAAMLSELPLATSFVTSIFLGRGEYARHESSTLFDARNVAGQMAAHYQNGRKALVYALLPNGRQFLVPDGYNGGETTMKTFNKRFNAQRAAKSALGKTAEEDRDFITCKNAAGEWVWQKVAPTRTPNTTDLTPPDFSAKTHARFRPKLAAVVAMVDARDIDGLRKFHINPSSTSPKAILRYRDRAIAALAH